MKKLLLSFLLLLPLQTQAARLFTAGNSESIVFPGSTSNYGTANQSYSVWFYLTASPKPYQLLWMDWNGVSLSANIELEYAGGASPVLMRTACSQSGGGYAFRYFNTSISFFVWHHLAMTIEPTLNNPATDAKMWIDGGALTQFTATGGNWSPANGAYGTGLISNPALEDLNMRIADFAWWQGVLLNTLEITALSRGARPDKVHLNPTRYYPLEGWQTTEPDYGPSHLGTTSITGTSRANGPPVLRR